MKEYTEAAQKYLNLSTYSLIWYVEKEEWMLQKY